jgi:hypothetical protein
VGGVERVGDETGDEAVLGGVGGVDVLVVTGNTGADIDVSEPPRITDSSVATRHTNIMCLSK